MRSAHSAQINKYFLFGANGQVMLKIEACVGTKTICAKETFSIKIQISVLVERIIFAPVAILYFD